MIEKNDDEGMRQLIAAERNGMRIPLVSLI